MFVSSGFKAKGLHFFYHLYFALLYHFLIKTHKNNQSLKPFVTSRQVIQLKYYSQLLVDSTHTHYVLHSMPCTCGII